MIILLLHLTSCSALDYEASLQSNMLLARTFELVGNRLQRGRLVSSNADTLRSQGKSDKANLIYCLLEKLRKRVWKRASWQQGGQGCPMKSFEEALKVCLPDEVSQSQNRSSYITGHGQEIAGFEPKTTVESMDGIDWNQYDDLLDQFLQPDILA